MCKVKLQGDAFKGVDAIDFEQSQVSHVSKKSLQQQLIHAKVKHEPRKGNNRLPKKNSSSSSSSGGGGGSQMDVPDNDSGVESDNSHGSFTSDGKSFNAGEIGEVDNDGLIDELDDGNIVIKDEDENDADEIVSDTFVYVGPPKLK